MNQLEVNTDDLLQLIGRLYAELEAWKKHVGNLEVRLQTIAAKQAAQNGQSPTDQPAKTPATVKKPV